MAIGDLKEQFRFYVDAELNVTRWLPDIFPRFGHLKKLFLSSEVGRRVAMGNKCLGIGQEDGTRRRGRKAAAQTLLVVLCKNKADEGVADLLRFTHVTLTEYTW